MYDKNNAVQLVIDEDILKEKWFGCHPCINTSSVAFETNQLIDTILKSLSHSYILVIL